MKLEARAARLRTRCGRIGLLLMISALLSACGDRIEPPQIVRGTIATDQPRGTRALTPSELGAVADWLASHRRGWEALVATPPAGTVSISLDSASQPTAAKLTLWPGPKHPGWNGRLLFERPAQKTLLIQSFSDADLAPIVKLADAARG